MKKICVIALLSFKLFVAFSAQAYTYTFNNKSDKEAEVRFQLAGIAEPIETVKVAALGTATKNIGVWNRAGLCMPISSIEIRFLPSEQFKKPLLVPQKIFDSYVNNGEDFRKHLPEKFQSTTAEEIARIDQYGPRWLKLKSELFCFDQTFIFYETSGSLGVYPILRIPE